MLIVSFSSHRDAMTLQALSTTMRKCPNTVRYPMFSFDKNVTMLVSCGMDGDRLCIGRARHDC